LVARCLHDWDNDHGLEVDGGGVIFGDGHVGEGVTTDRALAAVRAGNDDVEVAFSLGASQPRFGGEALYEAVREATGAEGGAFLAETMIPRPSVANPAQNWKAADVETLWDTPIVGAAGTTVGDALVAMLEPEGQFIRQVDGLGEGLAGSDGMLGLPLVGPWLTRRCCQAFHHGFVEPLSGDPAGVLLSLVHANGASIGVAGAPIAER
ncbi:MAG: hypothetical protein M3326_02455, partial [Actinomycetota bacterium]|nr:hypothetical protein [Actinomycetota bacterium]